MQKLFTDPTKGLAVKLSQFLEATLGEEGSLAAKNSSLVKQIASIDVQIGDLERVLQSNRERLTTSFIAMETAQARINQQLQFLLQRFPANSYNAR